MSFDRDAADLVSLKRAFEVERVYRDSTLCISSLAKHLDIPEYRLRKLIHERLGHRNFNAFLHEYRLREAGEALSDPAKRAVPILTIALTCGYGSINPFNRAFRALHRLSPSEYRLRALREITAETQN